MILQRTSYSTVRQYIIAIFCSYTSYSLAVTSSLRSVDKIGIPLHDGLIVAASKDIKPSLRHQNRVFKLSAALTVRRDGGPVIFPGSVTRNSQINHGLNGKYVSSLHGSFGLVFGIMWNIGYCVKEIANAVSTVCAHNAALAGRGLLLNGGSKVAIQSSGSYQIHGCRQAFKGRLNQLATIGVNFTHAKGFIQITVIASRVVSGNVQVDNVYQQDERSREDTCPIFQYSI